MRTVFETCTPREEVLRGDLREEMFAARLRDVIDGKADPVYQDPAVFFRNTFPTQGLKTLAAEALGRLTGRDTSAGPFIRLETAFGGGKTHSLIALLHLAGGKTPAALVTPFVDPGWLPDAPIPTVGVVGSDMDPANGIDHGGGVTTLTLWGEIAYQLGRERGYSLVEASDRGRVAPGVQFLEKLIGDGQALIMLDEVARYLRAAKAVPTENRKSDVAEQSIAFLMSLIEFAASRERVVVVVTLADSSDAFGRETDEVHEALAEAKSISARQERVITPTGETEIAAIVTHRLFATIDRKAAEETAAAYGRTLERLAGQGVDLPSRATRVEYAQEFVTDYPFHPELLTTLNGPRRPRPGGIGRLGRTRVGHCSRPQTFSRRPAPRTIRPAPSPTTA